MKCGIEEKHTGRGHVQFNIDGAYSAVTDRINNRAR